MLMLPRCNKRIYNRNNNHPVENRVKLTIERVFFFNKPWDGVNIRGHGVMDNRNVSLSAMPTIESKNTACEMGRYWKANKNYKQVATHEFTLTLMLQSLLVQWYPFLSSSSFGTTLTLL